MILIPNTGKLLNITGSKAQCIAHAIDVAIPIASQLSFITFCKKSEDSIFAITLQVYKRFQYVKNYPDTICLDVTLQKYLKMNKRWLWYIGFFAVLFTGYFIFVFSENDFSQSSLPVINDNVQAFSFVNQNGKKVTEKDVAGKVYVAAYFFTTCKGICPKMNGNMRRVFDAFKDEKDFMIISHTCMPETDSVSILKEYEKKSLTGTTNTNWNFVTGDKAALYKMARHSYLIDNNKTDTANKIADQFIHTQLFALVDKQTSVRGIYDGLKEAEIQKLLKDIRSLLKEQHQNRSLKGF